MKYTLANVKRIQKKIAAYQQEKQPTRVDEKGKHRYSHAGGSVLPGATEILGIIRGNEFLDNNPDKMEDARHVGNTVHAALDEYFKQGFPYKKSILECAVVNTFGEHDIRVKNAIKAAQHFLEVNEVHAIATEVMFVSEKLGYGGTIDLIAFVNGRLCVLDWKTGLLKPNDYLQQELYVLLIGDAIGVKAIDNTWVVQLNKETGEAHPKGKHTLEVIRHAKWILATYHKHESFKKLVDGRRRLTL